MDMWGFWRECNVKKVRALLTVFGLSMMLAETRLRRREDGMPKGFTVSISARPSRMMPAALGLPQDADDLLHGKPSEPRQTPRFLTRSVTYLVAWFFGCASSA